MRINLVANVLREDAIESATRAVQWLRHRNIEVGADEELAQLLGIETLPPDQVAICDLVVSFGGDGTLIKTAHLCSERGTPILGVYFGRFGFVTQCKPAELGVCLSEFIDGKAKLEERMMLQAELVRGDKIVTTLHALNEIALQRMISARMLFFSIAIDGKAMTRYPADGIIVSTPTGSTA